MFGIQNVFFFVCVFFQQHLPGLQISDGLKIVISLLVCEWLVCVSYSLRLFIHQIISTFWWINIFLGTKSTKWMR